MTKHYPSPYSLPSALQFASSISGYIRPLAFIISSTCLRLQSGCMCSSSEKWMNTHIWEQKSFGVQYHGGARMLLSCKIYVRTGKHD